MSTATPTSPTATSSPLKRLLIDHPLVAYFVIAFAGAWLTVLPLVISKTGLGVFSFTLPTLPFLMLGALAGPTLAAFTVTAVTSGKAGVWQLLRRYVQWRVGIQWYLLVIVVQPAVIVLGLSVWLGTAPLSMLIQQWPLIFTLYLPLVLTFLIIGGPLGEEPGWRGFALPRLQEKYGALLGSLVLGTLWALWHLPGYFGGWLGPFSIPVFLGGIIAAIAASIIVTWVYNNTQGSILIAVLFHSASNAAISLVAHLIPPELPQSGLVHFILSSNGVGVTAYGVCALLILIFTKGGLSYRPDREVQPAEAST